MPGVDLFGRSWRITVGTGATGLQLTKCDVEFNVKRALKPEPNTAELKLFNLTSDHQKQIEQNPAVLALKKVPVMIEAGYGTQLAQIFLGELRAGWTVNDGADVVTTLSTGDGEKGLATARLNVPFGPGTPISTVLQEIVGVLGLGAGNVQKAVADLQTKGFTQFSPKSTFLKGNAADHLTDFCRSVDLEWSIQDGAVQLLTLGQPLAGQALKLNSDTGMIGSPSVDSKGVLTVQTLMIPGIRPGQALSMDAAHIKGGYRIETVESKGDTLGNDWYHQITASKYRRANCRRLADRLG